MSQPRSSPLRTIWCITDSRCVFRKLTDGVRINSPHAIILESPDSLSGSLLYNNNWSNTLSYFATSSFTVWMLSGGCECESVSVPDGTQDLKCNTGDRAAARRQVVCCRLSSSAGGYLSKCRYPLPEMESGRGFVFSQANEKSTVYHGMMGKKKKGNRDGEGNQQWENK